MFGAICANRPVQTNLEILSPTQFTFTIPPTPPFTHVVIFLLPGQTLPPNTAAAVYIRFPSNSRTNPSKTDGLQQPQPQPQFRFLGAIGNEKQSAIFRVRDTSSSTSTAANVGVNEEEDEDAMVDSTTTTTNDSSSMSTIDPERNITLGISIEPAESIAMQLSTLKPTSTTIPSTTLTVAPKQSSPITTKVLAQRIIQNAFNYLASFTTTAIATTSSSSLSAAAGQGQQQQQQQAEEMVPLKAFYDWWVKLEKKLEYDPTFLEKAE